MPPDDLKPLLDSFRWRGRPAPLKAVVRIVEASDRWAFIVIVLIAVSAFWLPPALRATGLNLSAPIDDIWIHAQYARNLAQGRLSTWSPAAGYSLGATSALYPAALAAGWFIGFRGQAIMFFALLLNLAGLAVFMRAAMQLVWRGGGRAAAWLAPPLIALNGPLLWSAFSGMETGFSAGLLGGFLMALHRDFRRPVLRGPRPLTLLLAALVPLARPDWLLLVAPMLAAVCFMHRARWRARGWLLSALPLLPLLAWFALNFLMTGFWLPNSQALKSLFHNPRHPPAGVPARFLSNLLLSFPHHLYSVYGWAHLLILALLPSAPILARAPAAVLRRFRFDLALILAVGLHHLQLATLSDPEAYHFRYYTIDLALLVVVFLRFTGFAARQNRRGRPAWAPAFAPAAVFVAASLLFAGIARIPPVHDDYIRKWIYFHDSHISLGKMLETRRHSMPELDGPILLAEAGAIPYFAGGEFVDIMGLCTQAPARFSDHYNLDPVATFEAIERLPRDQWPTASVIYNHFGHPPFAGETLIRRAPDTPGDPLQITPWWLSVFRFPRELLTSGHTLPAAAIPTGWQVADSIDFVDLASEAGHDFSFAAPQPVPSRVSFATFEENGVVVGDCGRELTVPLEWTPKNNPGLVVLRVETVSDAPRVLELDVGDSAQKSRTISCKQIPGFPSLWITDESIPASKRFYPIRLLESDQEVYVHHAWLLRK